MLDAKKRVNETDNSVSVHSYVITLEGYQPLIPLDTHWSHLEVFHGTECLNSNTRDFEIMGHQ